MKKRLVYWIGRLAVISSLLLMVGILWTSAAQLRDLDWTKFLAPSLVGIGLYGVSLILQAWIWVVSVAKMTGVPWGWWDMKVYSATHFTRRIPGAPWYMASRVLVYREQGRSGMAALAASLVEWGGMLAMAVVWLSIDHFGMLGLLGVILVIGFFILLWPNLGKLRILPGRLRPFIDLPPQWVLVVCVIYIFAWLLGGIILYLLVLTARPTTELNLLQVTGLWSLGGGISLLAVMAPAGLGIREISLTLLLQPYLGSAVALVAAILLRVLFTIGDFVWGGGLWFLANRLSST